MVGELAGLRGVLERKRACFLFHSRHASTINTDSSHSLPDYGIPGARATGEISDDIPVLMRGQLIFAL